MLLLGIEGPPPQEQVSIVAETIRTSGMQLRRASTALYLHNGKMEALPESSESINPLLLWQLPNEPGYGRM